MSSGIETGDGAQNTNAPLRPAGDLREQRRGFGLLSSIILAVLVAALSFGGSTLGSYLSDTRASAQWEREFTAEWRQQILQKRIDIIERTVLAINNRDSVDQIMSMIRLMSAELTRAILDERPDAEITVSAEDLLPGLEQRLRVNEMSREFSAAMSLCAVYFGPETRNAIASLTDGPDEWWEQEESEFQNLSDALWSELSYDF